MHVYRKPPLKNFGRVSLFCFCAAFLFSCATTGPGGKKSLILISDQQEIGLGNSIAAELEKTEKPLDDARWQAYLTRVGRKIADLSDRPTLPYHFTVLDNDQVNAFAAPGGHLYFYTGILRMMDSEDELAAVMAHEISHVVGRHSVKTIQNYYGASIVTQLVLGEKSDELIGKISGLVLSLAMQGYGRSNEFEADEFGVYYMDKAGYNPNAAITMFEKLAAMSGKTDRGWFENLTASHPETKDRIARIKAEIAQMPVTSTQRAIKTSEYRKLKARLPAPKEKKP